MEHILTLLETYGYYIFIPLAIIEGPIVTVIAGFLVTLKVFNPFAVYFVALAGDFVGDSGLYALGRFGHRFVNRWGKRIGVTPERLEEGREFFAMHHKKAVTLSKLAHGVGFVGLITAGNLKVPFGRFIKTCFIITCVQSLIMLVVGIVFGHAYNVIAKYFDYYAALVAVAVLIIAFVFIFMRIRSGKKIIDGQ